MTYHFNLNTMGKVKCEINGKEFFLSQENYELLKKSIKIINQSSVKTLKSTTQASLVKR